MKKNIFINDWGLNPNPRIFYIADYLKNKANIDTLIIGRDYFGIPNRDDTFLINASYLKEKQFPNKRIDVYRLRFRIVREGLRHIITNKPDYIYIRSLYINIFFGLIKPLFRYKIIYETHGFSYKEQRYRGEHIRSFLTKILENFNLKYVVDFVVTNTKPLLESIALEYKINNKVFCVSNGIDLQEFEKLDEIYKGENERWIGFVGNWESWIRIEDLLKVSELSKIYKVIVVGEGRGYKKFKKEYPHVVFTGKISKHKALSYLKNMDICVSPWSSNAIFNEKSARKTFEYMALGKPIVVSNVPGKEEFLVEGENCEFYTPEDPDSLLKKVDELMSNKERYDYISNNNKKLSLDFTWDKLLDRSNLIDIVK
mgnify:CR=1 FL=1|jgi:glycosyltransferase involved in cell wall biosynthesis